MKLLHLSYIFMFSLFTMGCAPAVKINSEPTPNFHLSNYQTFAFFDVDASGDGLGMNYQQQIAYIESELTHQLKQRGLTPVSGEPDLLINLGIVVDEQVQTRETNLITDPPMYIGQRRYTWQSREVEVGRYKEGTISVHLVDKTRNELVWRGTAEGVLPKKTAKLQERIATSMADLVSRMP